VLQQNSSDFSLGQAKISLAVALCEVLSRLGLCSQPELVWAESGKPGCYWLPVVIERNGKKVRLLLNLR
jgi:hypothetical protein